MQNKHLKRILFLLQPCLIFMGCTKNNTHFYADAEAPGIAIFSNTGNNILTCFSDNKAWRTNSRITHSSFYSTHTTYEINILKQPTVGLQDNLLLSWNGYYSTDSTGQGYLNFVIPINKNFGYKNLNALQGQRLHVDTNNGFFSTDISGLNTNNTKGSGNIFFLVSQFDSIAPGKYTGKMSGLFDADFNSVKITKGRFDHTFDSAQIYFP